MRGGRILAVGRGDEIDEAEGPSTEVVDLGGHFVMPGFNDAHMHLASAGLEKLNVNLVGAKTLTSFANACGRAVQDAEPGDWVVGEGWDETLWPVKTPHPLGPRRSTADHPVFLERVDGHIAVANTRALQLASITVASKDPDGGKIDRDETGTPTGILRETARKPCCAVIPKPTPEKRRQAIEVGPGRSRQSRHHFRAGQFRLRDSQLLGRFPDLTKNSNSEGKLTARISEWLPFDDSAAELAASAIRHPAVRQLAAHRDAEGLHGWLAWFENRRAARALQR